MAEFTLRIRRYDPDSGEAPYWDEHTIDLEPHRSVLEGILQAKARFDGSIGIRCSCRAAICGSCGVRINGQPGLACHTHLDLARDGSRDGVIEVEPMGNMPVIKDLIVDMDAVHWKKIQRVTPWLIPEGPAPEREYIVPPESMIDVTQTKACIQCSACVSDCLAMEVDRLFIGPAALPDSYGGKFHPRAVPELIDSLPVITRALLRRKVTPGGALLHKHKASKEVKRIFQHVHDKQAPYELNLY